MAIKFPKSEKHNFTKNLVKRHKLVTHLDSYLATEVSDFEFKYEPKIGDDAWHPSGHCTPSVTDLYSIATEAAEPKDWGTAMLKTFMVGHFWHQLLQKAVVDIGFASLSSIERRGTKGWGGITDPHGDGNIMEYKYRPYHWATGAADVAPCTIPKHGDYVIDFKTMSSHQYKSVALPEWAAFKYECQINIYMDFFGIEKGLIVAVQKDSPHEFKEFEYEYNEDLVTAIYDKWKYVSECIDNDILPDPFANDNFEIEQFAKGPIAQ
jgi:hypothetical protein